MVVALALIAAAAQPGSLRVVVLQGDCSVNNIKTQTATQPVVEVMDTSGKPVVGAEAVFQLPAAGPGGVFYDWMRTQTVRTNAEGRAAASGLTPNHHQGRFEITVTATKGAATGAAVLSQTNAPNGAGAKSKSNRNAAAHG